MRTLELWCVGARGYALRLCNSQRFPTRCHPTSPPRWRAIGSAMLERRRARDIGPAVSSYSRGCTMKRFYLSSATAEDDLRTCERSRDSRTQITISGQAEAGGIEAFSGIVQSIADMGAEAPAARRWRVVIE